MDRNTIIGFSLIFLILAGYYWYTAPTPEQLEQMKKTQDSLTLVETKRNDSLKVADQLAAKLSPEKIAAAGREDSVQKDETFQDTNYVLANKQLSLTISNRGAAITKVQLNEFYRSDSSALVLIEAGKNQHRWTWSDAQGNPKTSDQFEWKISQQTKNKIALRWYPSESREIYIEQSYTLDDSKPYVVGYDVQLKGMQDQVRRGNSDFKLDWSSTLQKQEKDMKWDAQHTALVYKMPEESPTSLQATEEANETLKNKVQWIAFKQQYFSTIIASADAISTDTKLKMSNPIDDTLNIKTLSATLFSEYTGESDKKFKFNLFFGPNKFDLLESTDLGIANAELERIIPLGWGIFGWVNRHLVIPVFTWLTNTIGSMGIAIMLLTLVIKMFLLPLVYKSYISTAKMRILKPELDEIKSKHGNDLQKVNSENMSLYKKAGVSPLSGCIPMLLQLPILFAMFQFFPVAFELRQKTFLWSSDLSQWDGPALGFNIPFYGDHVSFFTLLMTVSTLIYTHFNNQISGVTGQMKWMGYFMPIIFLGVLNDYASGLTWYYFVSNMVTFGQQFVIRKMIDDSKLHQQIAESRKKPVVKSNFQKRMELAMKASQQKSKGKR